MEPMVATRADFTASGWEGIVESSSTKECHAYSSLFFTSLEQSPDSFDEPIRQVLILMGHACSMQLHLDTPRDPFCPMVVLRDGRSSTISDFDESRLSFMAEILAEITDAELRARVADVLYVRRPGFEYAEVAVTSYLESAKRVEDLRRWPPTVDRIERALQIASRCQRRRPGLLDSVIAHIEALLDACSTDASSFLSSKLMEMLQEHRLGDPILQGSRSELIATQAEEAGDWNKARSYWQVTTSWHRISKDNENARLSQIREAETYVHEAAQSCRSGHTGYMLASSQLQSAMEAMRRISGMKERTKEIHALLLEYEEKSVAELGAASTTVDIADLAQQAVDRVRNKPLFEALITLVKLFEIPRVSLMREQATEYRKEFILQRLFPKVMLNALGRVIARQPQSEAEAIEADAYQNASMSRNLHVQALIEPARQQIVTEHYVRYDDLKELVINNPLVRAGREGIVLRGLHAGLVGDFLVATHLLAPQLEDSIRYHLSRMGVITSGLNDDGIQMEGSLNGFLSEEKFAEPLRRTIGEDVVFDMRGLLVEQFGANLRNDTAHGLLDYGAFHSSSSIYLWWIALRFYLLPTITGRIDQADA